MTESSDRIESIFDAASALSAPGARAVYLDQACAGNLELRAEVEALLRADKRGARQLDRTVADGSEPIPKRLAAEAPGAVIADRYQLLEAIGEGGMGTVWLAQQSLPVKRKVALKLIKAGMDSKSVVARFEAERQALAVMDHPNIAKVLDGGLTDAGRPYFVMEYVKGVPITEYCDTARMSVPERLQLFALVCQAVQHAHQKGIIHRDLKPSNILVAPYDDRPVPKVIDFGLAKAMHQSLTARTLYTAHDMVLGTPLYMSPEQAHGNNIDVDTRSDIYSLGVLLYELLTGSTPLEKQRVKQAAWDEVRRIIREEDPPKPSLRLSSVETLPSLAASRHTEPARLTKQVRGELDWIVMKALDKDRTRRYETANGFAADVLRYLAGEPVLAAPPSARYQLWKFVRRYKGPVGAIALIIVTLGLGVAGTTWGLFRAEAASKAAQDQATRAEAARAKTRTALDEVSSEAIESLLSQQPVLTEQHKAFLRRALELYEEFAEDSGSAPGQRSEVARAHLRMSNIRSQLGELAEAEIACRRAVSLCSVLHAEFPKEADYASELATAQEALGLVLNRQTKRGPAEDCFRQSVELLLQLHRQYPNDTDYRSDLAKSRVSLANTLADRAERQEAEQGYREAIRLLEPLVAISADGEVRSRLANARYNLALLLDEMGESAASEAEYQRAIEVNEALVRDFPEIPDYVRRLSSCMINLSELFGHREAWEEAERLHRRGLQIQEQLTRDFPAIPEYQKFLGRTLGSLAGLLEDRGKLDESREMYRRAVEARQQLNRKYPDTPEYLRDLASIYNNAAFFELMAGRLGEAEAGFRGALAIQEPLVRAHPTIAEYRRELANSYGNLGTALLRKKAFAEAEQAFQQVLQQSQELVALFPTESRYLQQQGADEGNIAEALSAQNRKEEALEWFNRALEHLGAASGGTSRAPPRVAEWLLNTTASRAMTLEQLGRFSLALADWERCQTIAPPERQNWVRLRRALCLSLSGRGQEAVAEAEAVAQQSSDDAEWPVAAARVFARAFETSADREEAYAVRCIAMLQIAEQKGYFSSPDKLQELADDPHLASVRTRADYQAWFKQLTAKNPAVVNDSERVD